VGENGAGKSTLMKVLTGIHEKDAGTIMYKGKEFVIRNPREALASGIGISYGFVCLVNLVEHWAAVQASVGHMLQ